MATDKIYTGISCFINDVNNLCLFYVLISLVTSLSVLFLSED